MTSRHCSVPTMTTTRGEHTNRTMHAMLGLLETVERWLASKRMTNSRGSLGLGPLRLSDAQGANPNNGLFMDHFSVHTGERGLKSPAPCEKKRHLARGHAHARPGPIYATCAAGMDTERAMKLTSLARAKEVGFL